MTSRNARPRMVRPRARRGRKPATRSRVARPQPTVAGLNWLKRSFARPDFAALGAASIPDGHNARTLVKNNYYQTEYTRTDTNQHTGILVSPIPGIAYFDVAPAVKATYSHPYDGGEALLPPGNVDENVTAFRVCSLSAELVSTTNDMNWGGSIVTTRIPLTLASTVGPKGLVWALAGDQSIDSTIANNNTYPSKEGAYAVATLNDNGSQFTPLVNYMQTVTGIGLTPYTLTSATVPIVGIGNMDSLYFNLSSIPVGNTFVLRVWSTIEYEISTTSTFYPFSTLPPARDPVALALYAKMARTIPIAVPFKKNATFWQWLLHTIHGVSSAASHLPGLLGDVGSAVKSLTNAPPPPGTIQSIYDLLAR